MFLWSGMRHLGDFWNGGRLLEFLSTFMLRVPLLEMRRECWESFPDKVGIGTLISSYKAETGLLLILAGPQCSPRVETGMLGNFLSCNKGVKDRFKVHEGRRDFPRDSSVEKGLSSPGVNFLNFLELRQVPLMLRRGPQGPPRAASGKASLHAS